MKAYKHIILIAAVSFFASCAKNEVVEPLTPSSDASQVDDQGGAGSVIGPVHSVQSQDQGSIQSVPADLSSGTTVDTEGSDLEPGSAPGVKVVGITDAAVQ